MKVARRFRSAAMRTRQTITSFDNGWSILRQILTRSDDLVYQVGTLQITGPNVPGARVPVYEVFSEDEYSMEWFSQGLGRNPVLVDIGAHIGCFSLQFVTRHPGARVEAYEPTPSTGSYLQANVEANGLSGQIAVHRRAVAATAGQLVMADNGAGSGHNGVLHLGEAGSVTIEVPCVSLADVFEAVGGQVDLIKMDAEGAEYDIILNSSPESMSGVRRVVMEYHALPGHSFEELESRLGEGGLTLVRRERYASGLGLAWFARDIVG
ncbi:FkbM family methyltransferase [Aeromicrobium sp.]|uniref:FkbM family methyltransferase n=1 Tax=Aeromicrobium sp. TaxID=1871063 RepID=UPI0019B72332|nr:FkbM family methyltransferase [Aeromicrobium sp.]MBC7630274.1 FkbM family methyltransferase [Aeromicrobium sp.]